MQPNVNGPAKQVENADDVFRVLMEHFQRRPLLETVGGFLDELERNRPEPFRQCFSSKSRVARLVQEAPSEQYALVMLKYIRIDPMLIRQQVEQRLPPAYLFLKPQLQLMQQTQDPNKR